MEFGLFMELSVPRPWTADSERQVYENALEQVRLADELGFDYVWAVEHHFLEEYSHCSGPDIFLAGCAATMTKRIRVGHGIVACVPRVPEPHPGGRAGGRARHHLGRPDGAGDRPIRHLAGAERVQRQSGRDQEDVGRVRPGHPPDVDAGALCLEQGRMFSMPERAILPKPIQKPHPRMWVAVTSPGTEVDAADRGLGCLGLSPGDFQESEKKVANYRQADPGVRPGGRLRQRQGADGELPLLL